MAAPWPEASAESREEPSHAFARWLAAQGAAPTADAPRRVAALEARYGIRIPEDFRQYLLTAAPAGYAIDGEVTMWWELERICSIPDDYEHEILNSAIAAEANTYLFFADYMIWCWAWAVCCSDGPNRGRVAFIGGSPDGFVADSFTEFVERYRRDPAGMANTFPLGGEGAGTTIH